MKDKYEVYYEQIDKIKERHEKMRDRFWEYKLYTDIINMEHIVPYNFDPKAKDIDGIIKNINDMNFSIVGFYQAFSTLTEREQEMIRLRYEDGLSYRKCGDAATNQVSGSRAQQIIAKGIRKMRHPSRSKLYKLYSPDKYEELEEKKQKVEIECLRLKKVIEKNGFEDNGTEDPISLLDQEIDALNLPSRAANALYRAGIDTIRELTWMTEEDLSRLRNLGKKGLEEIRTALEVKSLKLREAGENDVSHMGFGAYTLKLLLQNKIYTTDDFSRLTNEGFKEIFTGGFDLQQRSAPMVNYYNAIEILHAYDVSFKDGWPKYEGGYNRPGNENNRGGYIPNVMVSHEPTPEYVAKAQMAVLSDYIVNLEVSDDLKKRLNDAGIERIPQLAEYTKKELMEICTSEMEFNILYYRMSERGISFKVTKEELAAMPLETFNLKERTIFELHRHGFHKFSDILSYGDNELFIDKNISSETYCEVLDKMHSLGLEFPKKEVEPEVLVNEKELSEALEQFS